MNNMWKILAVCTLGAGAFLLYKKYNPECVQNMQDALDNLTKTASKEMKNMME